MQKTMIILFALIFLVTACVPGQSTQELDSRVNTAVAQTMEAEGRIANSVEQTVAAQSALASPTTVVDLEFTPTETPLASPTFTPFAIDTFTPVPINPVATRRSTQAEYACAVINRRPFDLSEYNTGDTFDIKWTIVNIGSKAWLPGVDVKYYSGPQMATTNRVEIPKIMNPNDSYTIVMDAFAPDAKGRQVTTWVVDGPMCYPYTAITVR